MTSYSYTDRNNSISCTAGLGQFQSLTGIPRVNQVILKPDDLREYIQQRCLGIKAATKRVADLLSRSFSVV